MTADDTTTLLNDVEFHNWLDILEAKDKAVMEDMFDLLAAESSFDSDLEIAKFCDDLLDGKGIVGR